MRFNQAIKVNEPTQLVVLVKHILENGSEAIQNVPLKSMVLKSRKTQLVLGLDFTKFVQEGRTDGSVDLSDADF